MEGERERVTDSSETAADSNQSHEATLRPTWLIHKKQEETLVTSAAFLSYGITSLYS